MLKVTPFHPRTSALAQGQAWRRWAGYTVLSAYALHHEPEYAAIRNSAALIDVSPLYKYVIRGPDAERLLNRVLPRELTKLKLHQVMYTPWCDGAGKVIDDGTVSRLGPDTFRLTSADPNLRWLSQNAVGMDVGIEDVSERTAALALQGPTSRAILNELCDGDVTQLRFFRLAVATIDSVPVTISRTGYTGDLGYEIWLDREQALTVWDAIMDAGRPFGMCPAGIHALDIARIEAGLLMIDIDYVSAHRALIEAQKSSPFELDLGWTVDLGKPSFVGRTALADEAARPPLWRLRGIAVDWDSLERLYAAVGLPPTLPSVAWRTSVPVLVEGGGVQVGYATSGCWSPLLKQYIALAHLEAAYSEPGTPLALEVTVEHRRRPAAARVVSLPFLDLERKRA